jgi:hypothetical protein
MLVDHIIICLINQPVTILLILQTRDGLSDLGEVFLDEDIMLIALEDAIVVPF